jgi:hypothetical protein
MGLTIGQKYSGVINVFTEEAAKNFLEDCIKELQTREPKMTYAEAHEIELSNIGYYIGYYDVANYRRGSFWASNSTQGDQSWEKSD